MVVVWAKTGAYEFHGVDTRFRGYDAILGDFAKAVRNR
jgi:hypothetical protein